MPYSATDREVRQLRDEIERQEKRLREVESKQYRQSFDLSMLTQSGILFLVLAVVLSIAVSAAIAKELCERSEDQPEQPSTEIDQPIGPR